MLPNAYAIELQYRYDTAQRDRELRILASVREHEEARARGRATPTPVATPARTRALSPEAATACPA